MKCPKCESTQVSKNGRHHGKQNYVCKHCGRQFIESYSPKGYSDDVKQLCLKMYLNGMGFRGIERVTKKPDIMVQPSKSTIHDAPQIP